MADRVGQQFGSYRLVRLLGQGAFAEVYLGEHLHLGSQAAIKVLHANLASPEEIHQFRTEARTIVDLVHPHIVRLLDYDIEENTPFFVMDYAQGGTLRQRHPRGIQVPPATVVLYVQQVAQALGYAHARRLIHRDIKPENLLLGRSEDVLVSDFGIAIVASTRYEGPQNVAGTVSYMAPEQLQGKPQRASDQYALGIVTYEWLTGDIPFHGIWLEVASQHALTPPAPLRENAPMLSQAIEAVVLKALSKDPQARFVSVQAFADALEQASLERPSQFTVLTPTLPFQASTAPQPTKVGPTLTPPGVGNGSLPGDLLAAPTRVVRPLPEEAPDARQPMAGSASPLPSTLREPSPTLPTAPPSAPGGALWKRSSWVQRTLLVFLVLLVLSSSVLGALGLTGRGPLAFLGSTPLQPTRYPAGSITEYALAANATPVQVAFGPDGSPWFTEFDGNRIGHVMPQGTIREYPLPTSNSEPDGIVTGPDGNLWFTELKGNKIGRITPAGTLAEFPLSPDSVPGSIIVGPDGALWFTEGGIYQIQNAIQVGKFVGGNKIGRITTRGILTEYLIPTPSSEPDEIINGPDGNLWFTEVGFSVSTSGHVTNHDQIGRITPQGRITEYPLPTTGYAPSYMTTGSDGNLWFTAYNQGGTMDRYIGLVTPQGTISQYTLPLSCQPDVLVKGPDGNLWFNEDLNSKIGRITPGGAVTQYPVPTPNGAAGWMTLGLDGNFWFTEVIGNKIGRITLQGKVTEYPLPTPNSKPEYIVVGPDKDLWFVELGSNKIGRITSGVA